MRIKKYIGLKILAEQYLICFISLFYSPSSNITNKIWSKFWSHRNNFALPLISLLTYYLKIQMLQKYSHLLTQIANHCSILSHEQHFYFHYQTLRPSSFGVIHLSDVPCSFCSVSFLLPSPLHSCILPRSFVTFSTKCQTFLLIFDAHKMSIVSCKSDISEMCFSFRRLSLKFLCHSP